jgi:hypothetical protein
MSKNTNIADLINYISVDGSGNVVLSTGQLVATQNYVTTAVSNLVASAPSTLDTLNELATALGNDANFATTVATSIGTKLNLSGGTLTGALSGTSATFSSTLSLQSSYADFQNTTYIRFSNSGGGTRWGYIQHNGTDLSFSNDISGGKFTFDKAAIFSSDITGKGAFNGYAGSTQNLLIDWSASSQFTTLTNTELFFGTNAQRRMTITSGGNVGIGTSSPSGTYGKLSVAGGISILNDNNAKLEIGRYSSGIPNSYIKIGTGSNKLFITNSTDTADIFVIENTGAVGIGISSPTRRLHVYGSSTVFEGILVENSNSNAYALYQSRTANSNLWQFGTWNDNSFRIGTSGVGDFLTITSGGNVGIGFSSVTSKLQVAGEITTYAGTNTQFYAYMNYLGTTYNFGPGEATDNVDFKIAGGGSFTTGGGFRFFTQPGSTTPVERMRITSGGQIQIKQGSDGFGDGLRWINTFNNRWTFVVGGDHNLYIGFNEANRGIFNSSTGVYTAQSDVNKKKDFEQSTIGLNAILGLNPTLYRMKTDETESSKELGFIAQEVKEFIPQAYVENGIENKFIGLNYNAIVAALVKAVQELKAENDELREILNRNNII